MCTCNSCDNYNGRIVTAKPATVALANLEIRSEPGSDVTVTPTTEGAKFVWTVGGGLKLLDALGTSKTKAISQDAVNTAINTITALANAKATPADVATAVAALVDAAPATLDTLNELAAALGDDPNFAATTAAQIGLKANSTDMVSALSEKLDKAGGKVGGLLEVNSDNTPAPSIYLFSLPLLKSNRTITAIGHNFRPHPTIAGSFLVKSNGIANGGWVDVYCNNFRPYEALIPPKSPENLDQVITTAELEALLKERAIPEPFEDLVIGATTTWETSGQYKNNKILTLTQNTILSITGLENGAEGSLLLIQDSTGGRTVTPPAGSLPSAFTINVAPNGISLLEWKRDGIRILWKVTQY